MTLRIQIIILNFIVLILMGLIFREKMFKFMETIKGKSFMDLNPFWPAI